MIRTSVPRLRSVRFKDGRAPIRVIRPAAGPNCVDRFYDDIDAIAKKNPDMAGYAIVAWARDGGTSATGYSTGDPIPIMFMPAFVETALTDWVFSTVNER